MKKWEKEIVQKQINDEQKVIWRLRDSYKIAMKDVEEKIQILQGRPQTQSVIYQLKYQQELQKQLENTFAKMSQEWYTDIDSYLKGCYEEGFFETMYSLHNQGIPIILPFNQEEMAQMAAQSDYEGIKLSQKLYDDAIETARISRQEMTRGIANNEDWATIANRIAKRGGIAVYNATRIVRTESGRIHSEVRMKTMMKAKDEGADVVKQWDSTVDGRTRSTHVGLDGQTRELEQPFKSTSGATAMYPRGFGVAAEDINCRCEMLQRARWALDKSEIDKCVGNLSNARDEQLQEWADKLGVSVDELIKASNGIIEPDGTINHSIKAKNYNDFKKKYKTKSEDKSAQHNAQLEVLNEEKKKFMDKYGFKTETDAEKAMNTWEKIFGSEDSNVKKWKEFKNKESELKSKLSSTPIVELKKQLKKAEAEYKAILSKYKSEEEFYIFGSTDEIFEAGQYMKQIKDLQGKLGIVPEAPKVKVPPKKVEIPKVEPKTTVVDADFETLKKNAKHFSNGHDADKYHKEKNFVQNRWDNELSKDEQKGIYTYTTNAYSAINRDLRSDNLSGSRYKKQINDATKGLEKCLLAEDTVVFRGMTGGIDDFSIWCGIPKTELSKKAVQDSLIGSRLVEKGFMSTGTNAGSAWSGLKLEVYLPKGSQAMYVDPISAYSGEYEILVQRNSTFEIMEVKTDSRGFIEGLVLRLVEQKH